MKILIATPLYPPDIGGPATYAKLLNEGLPGRGIDVELLKFSGVRHLPKLIRHYVYYRRVLTAARGVDVILALDPVSVGFPAMRAARKAGKPFIVKIVGDYAWEQGVQRFGVTHTLDEFVQTTPTSPFVVKLQEIQKSVAEAANGIIVPSEYLKGIVTQWGIDPKKIHVIYNAVLTDTVGNIPDTVRNLPRPLIVTVGRLVSWKGIKGLMKVVDGLWSARREGSNATLVIVGSGPEEKALKDYALELGIKDHCVFAGELSHPDALAVMKTADVFVLNSSYEGLSHTLIEALQLGACIVATDAGGNPEVIAHGEGILINVGNERQLASSLQMLIEHREKRRELSSATKESAKRFSLETMLERTADFLKRSL